MRKRFPGKYWPLLVVIMATIAFIWIHSMFPKDISSGESSFMLNMVRPALELFIGKGNATEYLVRKLAHFTEYAVLSGEISFLLFGLHISLCEKKSKKTALFFMTFFRCELCILITAFLDETIQIFSGRGPMIADVWIDIAGGALGAAVILCIRLIRNV